MSSQCYRLKFEGNVVVRKNNNIGTFTKEHINELKSYLERAVYIDIDFEQEGEGPFDNLAVGSIALDWESLETPDWIGILNGRN